MKPNDEGKPPGQSVVEWMEAIDKCLEKLLEMLEKYIFRIASIISVLIIIAIVLWDKIKPIIRIITAMWS